MSRSDSSQSLNNGIGARSTSIRAVALVEAYLEVLSEADLMVSHGSTTGLRQSSY
jgi:hypothetical protein